MIVLAVAAARGGGPSSRASTARRMVKRLGSVAPASTLLTASSLSSRGARIPLHSRAHSSQSAALHPSPTAQAAAEPSTSTSGNLSSFEPFGTGRQSVRRQTRLPTPLPPDVAERRSLAFRKHLKAQNTSKKGGVQPRTLEKDLDLTQLTFGDLSSATLHSLERNESYFTPSQTVESLAFLRACLATGMIQRATQIFNGMREEATYRASFDLDTPTSSAERYLGPLEVRIYNAMLGAYLRKAWQEEDVNVRGQWLSKSWELMECMEMGKDAGGNPTGDPLPDEGTYAVMAKGIVRLVRSNRYPANQRNLSDLLNHIRRSGIRIQDIMSSSIFSHEQGEMEHIGGSNLSREGEPDARRVLQSLSSSAADMADVGLSSELDDVNRVFQGLESRAMKEALDASRAEGVEAVDQTPQLRPVQSQRKGHEMKEGELPFNLQVLRDNLSIVQEAKNVSADPYERQRWLEFGAVEAAKKRFEFGASHLEELGLHNAGALQSKDLQQWMWSWYKKLEEVLREDIERIRSTSGKIRGAGSVTLLETQLLPFVQLLSSQKLAMITILELMRLQGTGGVADGMKTASALVNIGKAVEREHFSEVLQKNPDRMAKARSMQSTLKQRGLSDMQARRDMKKLMDKDQTFEAESLNWSTNIRARVGSFVVQHLMNVATVKRSATDRDGVAWEEEQPAFYSTYQYIQGKRLGVIRINEVVSKRLAKDGIFETLHPRHLPMLVPPKPWLSYDSGGYYSVKSRALRFKDDFEQGSYLKAASDDGTLEYVLAGLDVLGSTAWNINKDVFAVVTEVWNSGKSLAEVPPVELCEEEPVRPTEYETDIRARAVYLQRLKHYNLKKTSNHSQRCDVNYKLEIARAFQDEKFFFPHNMDFRGRAYPIPPHLNHIGNDLCRGLLLFADAKPLGSVGLRWLRIHLANVYGYDKASFSEREAFSLEHEEDIRKSVQDPLGAGNWWLNADDPWQCLATCMELTKAMDHPEGPEKFESRLPVHQDGTCNGLQHYAALGGDIAGAKQVNLRGGDRPSDVYTAVADLVIKVVENDAEKGNEAALLVKGKITRKVVKQTVMTTVYGVTFIGAKDQVLKQLQERGLPAEHLWSCASYLAKQIMASIGDLFSGADAIQTWLKESALLIAKSIPPERLDEVDNPTSKQNAAATAKQLTKEQMTSVIWTTPLGLPVVQPYRKVVRKQVPTTMQSVFIHDPYLATQVSPSKQASAFPPNFIHSLDATHMFLTALECQSAELTFASVHDSYWTHACDIETMSDIIRDTFVRLHSYDILQKLADEVSVTARAVGDVVNEP